MQQETITVKDSDSIQSYDGFTKDAQEQIHALATTLSLEGKENLKDQEAKFKEEYGLSSFARQFLENLNSSSGVSGVHPLTATDIDPGVDPTSDLFNSELWVKNLKKSMDDDLDYYKPVSLGVAYRDLRAYGIASDADYQMTVANGLTKMVGDILRDHVFQRNDKSRYFDILKPMDALIKPGEVTVVLGRPGAGCSTLLKSISAHTHGFHIGEESKISYDGLTPHDIKNHYRGDVIYSAESDNHFPALSVGTTLEFAAKLRTPKNRPPGVTRDAYSKHMAAVYMATYGLSHTRNTKVGNEVVRGVSGGERKRVSIAEMALSGASIQCWDNSTRGLDAATALEFVKALKVSALILEQTPLIAIYQCSQDAYDLFDNVIVLYQGFQIFFGPASRAKKFFLDMGYYCPTRQTTADFLTSLTNPAERIVRPGFERSVPRTPKEFSDYWRNSDEYGALIQKIDNHFVEVKTSGAAERFHQSHTAKQSKYTSPTSPYTISYWQQTKACLGRELATFKADPSVPIGSIFINAVFAFVVGSIFYNLPKSTASFYPRSSALYVSVLINAFSSVMDIIALIEGRSIVEKHKQCALYHPSAHHLSAIIAGIPVKLLGACSFNLVFYFMINLKREAGAFFIYCLFNVVGIFAMSHVFRTVGAATRTVAESMIYSAILLLVFCVFTGFTIPVGDMLGWSRWINYINPVSYIFEALMANEFRGVRFSCGGLIPQGGKYDTVSYEYRICSSVGAVAGQNFVEGTAYIEKTYNYFPSHMWRNLGIVFAFLVFFLFAYLFFTEYNEAAMQKGEVILFQKSTLKKMRRNGTRGDIESANTDQVILLDDHKAEDSELKTEIGGTDVFHWKDICYDVQIKKEKRRILDHVDGWVKPGTLTALMGATGAGKTTLLDVLADRITTGLISGDMFVNGRQRDSSFQRSTGYAQQQDLHLSTATVREAFRFSAYLRQPATVSKEEKDDYVEKVIDLLEMTAYADAVVGVAGEGLNVEQRKRLTIGVELAAKPKLLLFLDEPTSGLDSQTAWSICKLIRKLANSGQAILCTIHQPSAILFQEFDRLLFLSAGGKTVYFGDMGKGCQTLINYFESHGSEKFPRQGNPAEFMLHVIGAAPGSHAKQDYHQVWLNSEERHFVRQELDVMEATLAELPLDQHPGSHREFSTGIIYQYGIVTKRIFQQYWRSPTYIYSKLALTIFGSAFNGFSFFQAKNSLQGLQNQMFSVFLFALIANTLIQQMVPSFVAQRAAYEAREGPSKTFSWLAFILAQITVEMPWNFLCGTISFFCWYYPVGFYRNAPDVAAMHERGALAWLFCTGFFIFSVTLGQVCIAGIEDAENAGNLAAFFIVISMDFCGVFVAPKALPGFWVFLYRVSPFSYLFPGLLATSIGDSTVECSDIEYKIFDPPPGQTCEQYMVDYVSATGGYLLNSDSTSDCKYCTVSETNAYLESLNTHYDQRWRNYGIFVCYIAVNVLLTVFFYWLARVPKGRSKVKNHKDQTENDKQAFTSESQTSSSEANV